MTQAAWKKKQSVKVAEQRAKLMPCIEAGMSIEKMAEKFGVTSTTIKT